MRIANIIEDGKLVGPQTRIALVASSIKSCVETTVIMPEKNSKEFQNRCEILGVPYKTLPITHITKDWREALRYVLFFCIEIIGILFFIKRGNFDLIHVSGGCWQFKGIIVGRMSGKAVLWHLNDTAMPLFIRKLFSIISPLADGFIFASKRTREYYRPLIRRQRHEYIIPAPVDTAQFDPQKDYFGDNDLIEQLGQKIVIGTVANINPVKGLDVLIRTAGMLNKHGVIADFVVIGPVHRRQKGYFQGLQHLCQELGINNLLFVGGRLDIRPLLKRFDIYVCASYAESSPIAVWEAMSMAKPVVSTDVGDVPFYLKDGLSGYIVDAGDSRALCDRLIRLVNDSGMRKSFGYRARSTVIKELNIDKCAERHITAYNEILKSKDLSP